MALFAVLASTTGSGLLLLGYPAPEPFRYFYYYFHSIFHL